uniref:Uncharacterized protein n=1 Tax=Rhizophora mucronata TaxID=61149 RepID=A0A2P2JFB0_RHIMU
MEYMICKASGWYRLMCCLHSYYCIDVVCMGAAAQLWGSAVDHLLLIINMGIF